MPPTESVSSSTCWLPLSYEPRLWRKRPGDGFPGSPRGIFTERGVPLPPEEAPKRRLAESEEAEGSCQLRKRGKSS
ncbi:Hypothetical predicted protein [Podarcis lilfordi]|uniref:Uncharacterized protein n=1 Tax=Podarcis lilfordi TaxID=74358 RepID=A0AA35P355_9SAUR|nr:Hypothetical predicted protein [Podarcis lilfordi]